MAASHGDGSRAYVIKCSALQHVANHLHAYLRQAIIKAFNDHFEQLLYRAFIGLCDKCGIETGLDVGVPLVVDHVHGFSVTWNRTVDRPFE